jgi:hypothetical protein
MSSTKRRDADNSKERAERARTLFGNSLGTRIASPLMEIESLKLASRSAEPKSASTPLQLSPEQCRTIIHQSMDRHYRRMLNEPVPMLGNRAPRKAVKTEAGRQKVVAWLKLLENHSANIADTNDPMASYDFSWLWVELGVSRLRH